MKHPGPRLALLILTTLFAFGGQRMDAQPAKIRVLLVTGGHAFEREQFFRMFETNTDIIFRAVEHTNLAPWLKADAARN